MIKIPYVEENCTIEFQGKKFESGGAIVTADYLIAYPSKNGILNNWHGEKIGIWKEISKWKINSYISSYMHQIECTVNGITYTGRGHGGMIFKGKKKRGK